MNPTSSPQSLASVIDLVEQAELVRRKEDAHRLRLLATALSEVQSRSEKQSAIVIDGSAVEGRNSVPERVPFGSRELAYRSLRAELATALTLSEYAVDRELALADTLTSRYPAAFAALEQGSIAKEHTRVLTDEGVLIGLGDDPVTIQRRAAYEAAVLEEAQEFTPNQLRPIAKRLAEVWAECTIEVRHREARKCRSVTVVDAGDGMADLLAHLPLVEAVAIKDRLTQIARTVERGQRIVRSTEDRVTLIGQDVTGDGAGADEGRAEARTRDQLRADAFVELLLESDVFELAAGSPAEAIQARVQLTAPAELTHNPDADCLVELVGYSPIDSQIGRQIAAHASHWENVTTHPDTGTVLTVDRYRPSSEMRRLLGARDQTCRFPGCRTPVHRCDFDHTIDAAAHGVTSTENLAALCRGHHTLKHHTKWRVEQLGGGVLRWISPAGKRHTTRPPNVTPPKRQVQRTSVLSAESVSSAAGSTVRFESEHPF